MEVSDQLHASPALPPENVRPVLRVFPSGISPSGNSTLALLSLFFDTYGPLPAQVRSPRPQVDLDLG
jgi:hypothetical protein